MLSTVLKNWTIWRFLRLGIAIFLVTEGITESEWFLLVIAGALLVQVVLNIGCSGRSCAIPEHKKNSVEPND